MGGTRFMVQWEEHPSHLATRLGQLLEHQTLVDVTLMCNTHTLRVHRAVLAACSPYFETILQRQLGLHPLIVLKDMQFSVLKSLIEFMYCGETSVTEDNLGALLQAAKFFQVKGLSAMTREALGLPSSTQKPATTTTTTTVNGEASRKAFMGRSKRVGIQQTLVPASGLKSNMSAVGDATKTTFQVASKTVPMSSQQQTHQQAESAQLLLSLSGGDFGKQQSPSPALQTVSKNVRFQQPRMVSSMDARKDAAARAGEVMERLPVMTTTAGISKHLLDKQEVKTVYMPEAPRRRGRPLKRSMNLVFKEKVISETELALQKEAEASRKALEALQEEMKSDSQQQLQQQQQQQQMMSNKTVGMMTAQPAKMHIDNPVIKPSAVESGVKDEPLYQVSDASGENVIYQLADGSDGGNGNIMYKVGDQIITAPGGNNDGNIVYQLAEGIKSGDIVYQVADNSDENQEENSDPNIIYQVAEGENVAPENTVSNQCMEVLKEAGLPTNVPILLDSGDGQYITVNEEVLMNIVNGGMVQVADGNIVGGEGLQFIVQELPEEPGAPLEETHVSDEPAMAADLLKDEPGPITTRACTETLVEQRRQDSLDTPVIENTLNTLAELTLTTGNPQVEQPLQKSNIVCGSEGEALVSDMTGMSGVAGMHADSDVITGVIGENPMVKISGAEILGENEVVSEDKITDGDAVVDRDGGGVGEANERVCEDDETEVITGDRFGEEARSGFSVLMKGGASPSKDEFPSQFLEQDNSVAKYAVTTTACGAISQNFMFQEESSSSEAPEKVSAMEQGKTGGTMSVEQALEAMMGETSDTDDACKEKGEDDSRETVERSEVGTVQPGSTTDDETQDLRMVLSPEEARDIQSADDSLDDSILMVLSPDGSANIKLSDDKSTANGALVGRSTSDVESILLSDADASARVTAREDRTAGEFVVVDDGTVAEVGDGSRVALEGAAEYGPVGNSRSATQPENLSSEGSTELGVVDDAAVAQTVVSGVELLEDGSVKTLGEDAPKDLHTSPPKDIPYAVGLLPLKTALEKLQAMPEYHPRKTRSCSKDSPPECRAKRKASSCSDPEKRQRVSEGEDEDDLDAEDANVVSVEAVDAATIITSPGVGLLPSMVDLTSDANDG